MLINSQKTAPKSYSIHLLTFFLGPHGLSSIPTQGLLRSSDFPPEHALNDNNINIIAKNLIIPNNLKTFITKLIQISHYFNQNKPTFTGTK